MSSRLQRKDLIDTPKLMSDWMLVDVLDAKERDTGQERTAGGIIVPSTVSFTGLRHCRILLIGPGIIDSNGDLIGPDCKVDDYILIAGEDMIAEVRTQIMDFSGHFAMARSVVAYAQQPIH